MTISKELLDELLTGVERAEDLLGDAGLLKELKIRLMERMLGAELTAHLGYEEGKAVRPAPARLPSSRAATKTRMASIRSMIVPIYAKLTSILHKFTRNRQQITVRARQYRPSRLTGPH
ncbi:hypothetical protein AAC691_17930 [Nguyenibacter vanlangensis]|uniref:Transposase, Mutator family n=1 Tax=Nguyenibacter vanlangensis TaxID=1216886 RepID=A0ABZ3D2Y9_9PROT